MKAKHFPPSPLLKTPSGLVLGIGDRGEDSRHPVVGLKKKALAGTKTRKLFKTEATLTPFLAEQYDTFYSAIARVNQNQGR